MRRMRELRAHLTSDIVPVIWDAGGGGRGRKATARRNAGGCGHVERVRGGSLVAVPLLTPELLTAESHFSQRV